MDGSELLLQKKYYQRARNAELVRGGKMFFGLLEKLILDAGFEVHLQFYIFEFDETGKRISDALLSAAGNGVSIFVVLDAYGSSKLPHSVIKSWTSAGIRFKWFRPVIRLNNMEFGRRMHHKIVAIDENIALVTGVNIADRYNDVGNLPAWLDFALMVEGLPALEIKRRCIQILESRYKLVRKWKKFRLPPFKFAIKASNPLIKVSVNDWLRGRMDIYYGYRNAFSAARKEILILGGYFLPGRSFRRRLREANERGVDVKVILTAISDVPMAKEASEYLYRWMFKNNIGIFEWKPTILHGKVAVVDKEWSTVGSYNLNYLSTFESIELNVEVIDNAFSEQLSGLLHEIAANECIRITQEEYFRNFSIRKRIKNWFSYLFIRNSMRILNAFSHRTNP